MQSPHTARRALTRALIAAIPVATLAFVPLDFLVGATQTPGLIGARVVLIGGFGLAAWVLPRLSDRAARVLYVTLSVALSGSMALLCQGTGGATSPAFGFMWALPMFVGLMFMNEPLCPLMSGLSSLPLGGWLLSAGGKTPAETFYWLGVTTVATGLAAVASVLYRRLQRTELGAEKDTQRKLAQRDRLTSLGSLAGGMAHEINTPLTVVMLNLDLLDERFGKGDPALVAALRDTREAATRIGVLVQGMVGFAHGGVHSDTDVTCDLDAQLKATIDLARPHWSGRAEVQTQLGGVGQVRGSAAGLGVVFFHLLLNAAQAFTEARPGNLIRVVTYRDGDRVVAEVHDTGCGIPPDILPRIFDPFFTTRAVGGGPGLGLSICHGIVRDVGGEIQVESEPGRGTVVRVLLTPAA